MGLFTLVPSILISAVSSLAFFFMTYELMQKTYKDYIINFKTKALSFYNNLQSKHWFIKLVTASASIGIVLISAYLMAATTPTWWLETQLGALLLFSMRKAAIIKFLSAPFAIISNGLYAVINSLEAIEKFSDFGIKFNFWQKIKDNIGLKYNPFYLVNSLLVNTTGFLLFTAHAVAHALMAGRTSFSTIAGTIIDFFADANFTVATRHSCSHEPFDFIVMLTKVGVSLPLQLLAVPTNILLTKFSSNDLSWSNCIKKSFKECFEFVIEYTDSKKHSCCHHNHGHKAAELAETVSSDNRPASQKPSACWT